MFIIYFLGLQYAEASIDIPLPYIWFVFLYSQVKFIYSEKATKFCEISTLLLTVCTVVKFKVEISQNFVPFSEYMNFTSI